MFLFTTRLTYDHQGFNLMIYKHDENINKILMLIDIFDKIILKSIYLN